jgi:hypothetical protein
VLRASVGAERAGVPAVSVVASSFIPQARIIARSLGVKNAAIVEYPGHPTFDDEATFNAKLLRVSESIADILAVQVEAESTDSESGPLDVVFEGTLDEVQDYYDEQLWTDGLPIVPPTVQRVNEFLRFTDRSPTAVIGALLPDNREATVWNVAVNGVMAGCRPEYMPILLAIVEAVSDPRFRVQDAGSTPGWEPVVILNGRIIGQLGFHAGPGLMRVGMKANTTVGRFLRLYLRNVAGLRVTRGIGTDKGSIAQSFNVVMAEDEETIRRIGWSPFSSDRGFRRDENVVTVQSVVYTTPAIYSAGMQALEHAKHIADIFGESCARWASLCLPESHHLLLLGPGVADVIARDGWSKDRLRRFIIENAQMPAQRLTGDHYHIRAQHLDLQEEVRRGNLPAEYGASDDPARLVPVFRPHDALHEIGIVVAGDPGRNQSKGYIQNHLQGPPVTKPVALPERWVELIDELPARR